MNHVQKKAEPYGRFRLKAEASIVFFIFGH
jgi:hypothetical protein